MTLYKNITDQAFIVEGFLVEAGKTIEHELIENANFEVVEASIKTVENATLNKEIKETK